MVLVTYPAPNFTAPAILNNGQITNNFQLKKHISEKKAILFFWPMDFTFVCPSEIIALNASLPEFQKRNTEVIGISIDSVYVHNAWRNTLPENGGIGKTKIIMVSDIKREIQRSYGIEHPELGIALRGTFLIDKNRIVRHQTINDLPFGRNIPDIIRMVDALSFYEKNGEVCPANWKLGKSGMKASQDGVKNYLTNNLSDIL